MHVALLNYEKPPYCGGGGQFTADLADELGQSDTAVTTIYGQRDNAVASSWELLSYPFSSMPDIQNVADRGVDVLNGHFTVPTSLLLPVAKMLYDVPLVVNVMGADLYDPTRYRLLRPVLDVLNNHWVLKHADRVVVPSSDMRDRLPERHQKKTKVIPYFTDVERFSPTSVEGQESIKILSVCRLVERKNLETALEVVRHLVGEGYDVSYTIAGTGEQTEQLKDRAAQLGVSDVVTFAGFVPDEDLPSLYRSHDVFLLPSFHEAFGIVFIEAMASGLPIVTSDVGGQTDIVTPSVGETHDPTDSVGMADSIIELCADLERYSTNARDRAVSNYSPVAVREQYDELYQEVAQ